MSPSLAENVYRWVAARPIPAAAWALVRTVRDRAIVHPIRRSRTARAFAKLARRNDSPRVTIGCGRTPLPGWFNTDLEPALDSIHFLDATRPLPFPDASIDAIYSEHCVEHLPFEAACRLFQECRRVLRAAGRLRVVVPDVRFAVRCYAEDGDVLARYRQWFSTVVLATPRATRAQILNAQMRLWGHQFLYDFETLAGSLAEAGFTSVERFGVGESDDPALSGIEQHGRIIPEEWNRIESLVVEASGEPSARPPERASREARAWEKEPLRVHG